MKYKILIVDDDETICFALQQYFGKKGWDSLIAMHGQALWEILQQHKTEALQLPDVILLDVRLPDCNGLHLLEKIKKNYPMVAVVIITGYGNVPQAVTAMQEGASDYLLKPFNLDELQVKVDKALETRQLKVQVECLAQRLQKQLKTQYVQGPNEQMRKVYADLAIMAASPSSTVLIYGETGTGKEVIAQQIHALSTRRHRPFIEINATALPLDLLESELFGHELGAFTGAIQAKKGLFEIANGGSLFLDEIGDMHLATQAKILRALQEKKIRRVGGVTHIPIDVRMIAASNKNLEQAVKAGSFREDLYYRLNVLAIHLPALRDRIDDIEALCMHFIQQFNQEFSKQITCISPAALAVLKMHSWKGNVRELRNLLERSILLECHGNTLEVEHLRFASLEMPALASMDANQPSYLTKVGKDIPLEMIERQHIEYVLKVHQGNKNLVATILGIDRSTLYNKLKKYQISTAE